MTTSIAFTPRGWHWTDGAPNTPETVLLRDATEAQLDVLDLGLEAVPLVANGTSRAFIVKPGARVVTGIRVRRQAALATGTITLAVQDGDGNTLLSAATIDATALTASFVAQTLTATTANLSLAAGEPIQLVLVSNNSGSTGGPVIVEVTYAAA